MIEDKSTGIMYREDTFDSYILKESRGYFPIGLKEGDRILDLGGHIGTFASRAMKERIVPLLSLEPESSNFQVLEINAARFGFTPWHVAIVADRDSDKPVTLYVNDKTNNALHSTVPVRGRRTQIISGVGFAQTIKAHQPTIIKCDIEGAEYDLDWKHIPDSIYKIIIEFHMTKLGHRDKAQLLQAVLRNKGFKFSKEPRDTGKNWATVGVAER